MPYTPASNTTGTTPETLWLDTVILSDDTSEPEAENTPEEENLNSRSCSHCGGEITGEDIVWMVETDIGDVCEDCYMSHYSTCERCTHVVVNWQVHEVFSARTSSVRWCTECVDRETAYCEVCGGYFDIQWHSMTENHYGEYACDSCYEDSPDELEEGCNCYECRDRRNSLDDHIIWQFDYVPSPLVFHGRTNSMDTGPFFGMEVETSWNRTYYAGDEVVRWYNKHIKEENEDLIYIKTDSSVDNGFEIVTHPFTFEFAQTKFPWKAFDSLVDDFNALETDISCGGHIHINKDSFTPAHLWKFIQFHHRLGDFCELMGGRDARQWGTLKSHFSESRAMAKEVAMQKRQRNQQRYQGLNFLPSNTVELRYPAGGSSAYLMKKNLQLAHSIWRFTKDVDIALYRQGIMDDPGYFLWWIRENEETYPELVKFINTKIPAAKPFTKETN